MFGNNQNQNAGDNSQQVQALVYINQGIDENRVHEIFDAKFNIVREELSQEARQCAYNRVQLFENVLIPEMQRIDGALNMFSDPAFQMLLTRAQRAAAITDEKDDYELLTELLAHHVQYGNNRKSRASILNAIDCIDQIDQNALCALTIVYAMNYVVPVSDKCSDGIQELSRVFGKLLYCQLPVGNDWLDHLDSLKLVRMSSFSNIETIADFYSDVLDGYICGGIVKGSNDLKLAKKYLDDANIGASILEENELLRNYERLNVSASSQVNQLPDLTSDQHYALQKVWQLYQCNPNDLSTIKNRFTQIWDRYPILQDIHEWWETPRSSFEITLTGKLLAYINIRRCIPDVHVFDVGAPNY